MKTTVLLILTTGMLLAQSNNINGNNINTNGGDVKFEQYNNQISKEQISIDEKINSEIMKLDNSNIEEGTKNYLFALLNNAKQINQKQIPIKEKNRECKFNAKLSAKAFKFLNLKLVLSYCEKVF